MGTKHALAVGVIGILAMVGLLGWGASAQAPAPAPATLACDHDPPPDTNQPRKPERPTRAEPDGHPDRCLAADQGAAVRGKREALECEVPHT